MYPSAGERHRSGVVEALANDVAIPASLADRVRVVAPDFPFATGLARLQFSVPTIHLERSVLWSTLLGWVSDSEWMLSAEGRSERQHKLPRGVGSLHIIRSLWVPSMYGYCMDYRKLYMSGLLRHRIGIRIRNRNFNLPTFNTKGRIEIWFQGLHTE